VFDDVEGGEDVFIIGLSKKEREVVQHKTRSVIVNKACNMAIERKANGMKLFFVTCDSTKKPKAPYTNIWINMLCGYCHILDPSINNINAQPHILMNLVKNKLEENWEYVEYDLSYRELKAQLSVQLKNK
jgi:hypothetical protein